MGSPRLRAMRSSCSLYSRAPLFRSNSPRDRRKPRINRPRSVPSRKRNTELVAFANSLMRLLKNEVRGVTREILRSNDVRLSFHRQNTLFSHDSARDTQLIHSPLPFEGRGFGERSALQTGVPLTSILSPSQGERRSRADCGKR